MNELDIIPKKKARPLFDPPIVRRAIGDSFAKLDPRHLAKNPVMFVVAVGSVITTVLLIKNVLGGIAFPELFFQAQIAVWLWFTVLFANFAEAMAEGRGKAQADALKRGRKEATARRELGDGKAEIVPATALRKNDVVLVQAGEVIPSDGEVIEGVASVNESAITGESAPVIRESGGDRS